MQAFANGLISGSAIALLAVAFQVVYLPTRVFFIGLAGVYTLAPFIAYAALVAGAGWPAALAAAVAVSCGLCLLIEWASHARLARQGASGATHLIASLGVYIVLVQAAAWQWGSKTKTLPTGPEVTSTIGQLMITRSQWFMAMTSSLLIAATLVFLKRAKLGVRLRAMADNPTQFALLGYSVAAHRLLAFGIAGALAAASAIVIARDTGFDPYGGLNALLLAVVAVVVGGRRSFFAPALGALLLGLLRSEVTWYFSARWQVAATFGVFAILLLLRPEGLFTATPRAALVE